MPLSCITVLLHCCCTAACLCFRLLPGTWYRYVPVRVSVPCLLCVFPRACLSRSVRRCRLCLLFCAVVYCVRVRCNRGRLRGLHGIHSRLPRLSYNYEVFLDPARSSGTSFRVGQSHKDVIHQMHHKTRFSLVYVFRIFAEIWSVIRQIHLRMHYINIALLLVAMPLKAHE